MTFLPQGWILQQWQYGGTTAAEKSIDEAISTARDYAAAGIAEKVCDGLTWMGNVAIGSPSSLADVIAHRDKCLAAGLVYLPWTNPLHGSRNFLSQQARQYAAIGKECGFLVWDSEPYASFWGANRPVDDAAIMLEEFRSLAPNCANIWQPDPRPGRLAELRPDEWAEHMNVYAPQSYWTDFGTAVEGEIDRAAAQAEQFGIAECAPTIPANGDPAAVPVALGRMATHGMVSCLAWRLGTLTPEHMGWLRDLAGAGDEPEPTDPCADLRAENERLVGENAKLYAGIDEAIGLLTALKDGGL